MSETKTAKFSSRWGFILSAVGSAVGMANVWGFPAKMGANAASLFLLQYQQFFHFLFEGIRLHGDFHLVGKCICPHVQNQRYDTGFFA